jgi:hypothetical protein
MLISIFFRNWPFSGEDDRGKTSPRALVFTRCDIQSERLYDKMKIKDTNIYLIRLESVFEKNQWLNSYYICYSSIIQGI